MRDANIDQYLDFQSGAYATQNPLHWASWALNLVTPVIIMLKWFQAVPAAEVPTLTGRCYYQSGC